MLTYESLYRLTSASNGVAIRPFSLNRMLPFIPGLLCACSGGQPDKNVIVDSPTPTVTPAEPSPLSDWHFVYWEAAGYSEWERYYLLADPDDALYTFMNFGVVEYAPMPEGDAAILWDAIQTANFPEACQSYPREEGVDSYTEYLWEPFSDDSYISCSAFFGTTDVPQPLMNLQTLMKGWIDQYFDPPAQDEFIFTYSDNSGGDIPHSVPLTVNSASQQITYGGADGLTALASTDDIDALFELLLNLDFWHLPPEMLPINSCDEYYPPTKVFTVQMGSNTKNAAYVVGCVYGDPAFAAELTLTRASEDLIEKYFGTGE